MTTNISNITAGQSNYFEGVNDLQGLLNVPNLTTGGYTYVGLMVMMQFIIFMALLPFGFTASLITSAFIVLISGMFLVFLNLLAWQYLMLFLGQILLVIIYITWQEKANL